MYVKILGGVSHYRFSICFLLRYIIEEEEKANNPEPDATEQSSVRKRK